MWVGQRAGQNRKDMPSYAEILLLRNLGNHTKPLTDAKEVPLNMKGKNGGYRERAFNLGDKLPDSIMFNESHQSKTRLKKKKIISLSKPTINKLEELILKILLMCM